MSPLPIFYGVHVHYRVRSTVRVLARLDQGFRTRVQWVHARFWGLMGSEEVEPLSRVEILRSNYDCEGCPLVRLTPRQVVDAWRVQPICVCADSHSYSYWGSTGSLLTTMTPRVIAYYG